MKKVYVLLFVAASFGTATKSHAQQAPDLRAQATEATRKLAQQISLDDARSVQVRRLTYERLVQEAEVTRMYADDPTMHKNKLRVVGEEYAEKLKGVLNETQYQRYTALNTAVGAGTGSGTAAARP